MKGLKALLSALERDEGLRLRPYLDTASPPRLTIGYGRNLTDRGISYSEANDMLENDAYQAIADAKTFVPNWDALDVVRQNVLANMAFNLGKTRLATFKKMLAAVNEGRYEAAAYEMVSSKWFGQTGKRAQRLEQEMLTGVVA